MSNRRQETVATPAASPSNAKNVSGRPGQSGEIEVTINGVRIEVSPELAAAVHRAYKGVTAPMPTEMTTTQAAEFLDVSRPFVIKLIKKGELPCRLVGTHRRIPSAALLEYREKMYQRAKSAVDELTRMAQDLGLYDADQAPQLYEAGQTPRKPR